MRSTRGPRRKFVAGFIGTSNLTGAARADRRASLPGSGEAGCWCPATARRRGLELTVRPEKITIVRGAPDGDLSVVRGTVAEVVYLGTYNSYTVSLADGAEITVFQQNAHDRDDHRGAGRHRLAVVAAAALLRDRKSDP